ncbi:MAG: metal-dependent hydrolase [Acidimicrobiales bacterium]
MLLWFIGLAWLVVYVVFQSPALDYRLVTLGAVLPLADAVTGGAWVLHSLLASVGALALVMLATRRRRLVRRRWLGVPIGMFVHLVLDGVWTNTTVFWWPFFGSSFAGEGLPEVGRGPLIVVMELVGVAALVWGYTRFDLRDPAIRRRFLTTGQLPR